MAITHVKVFVQSATSSAATTGTFSNSAGAIGNAIVFIIGCSSTVAPTGISLTATGWTITQLIAPFGASPSATGTYAVFVAIAPSTTSTTFTWTFTGGSGFGFNSRLADEFTGNDQTGSTTTFDAHASASNATTYANLSVTPANNNDAVWFALYDSATAASGAYTTGGNDGSSDLTEYKILSGGSGVAQTSSWTGSTGAYLQAGVTIKPSASTSVVLDDDTPPKFQPAGVDWNVSLWR